MNSGSVVVGWTGLSLALVVGYGAYKNKPVFGAEGIVTQAIQTGKISSPKMPGPAPTQSVYKPGVGWVDPVPSNYQPPQTTAAPVAPAAPTTSNPLSGFLNALKGLFGGTPTTTGEYV